MDDVRRSRSRWRAAFFVSLALGVAAAGALLYGVLDQAVALTHLRDEYTRVEEDLTVALALMPALQGRDRRTEVLATLRRQHARAFITTTDSTVRIGTLTLRFGTDGRLRGGDRMSD